MNRQLFIHHYLPAHLCSALVAGAVFNFILSESINYPISIPSSITRLRPRQYSDLGINALGALLAFNIIFIAMFLFIAPLTYGSPGFVISGVHMSILLMHGFVASMVNRSIVDDFCHHGLYISQ